MNEAPPAFKGLSPVLILIQQWGRGGMWLDHRKTFWTGIGGVRGETSWCQGFCTESIGHRPEILSQLPLFSCCVSTTKLLNISELATPHVKDGGSHSVPNIEASSGFAEIQSGRRKAQCPVQSSLCFWRRGVSGRAAKFKS